jgi:hypothetical protein
MGLHKRLGHGFVFVDQRKVMGNVFCLLMAPIRVPIPTRISSYTPYLTNFLSDPLGDVYHHFLLRLPYFLVFS